VGRRDDHDPPEGFEDLGSPRPAGWHTQPTLSATAGEPDGHMQHPEPQLLWLSLGQIAIQGKQLQPRQ
jgi:hypothetical protein